MMADLMHLGIELSSRYDEPGEIGAMKGVIDCLPEASRGAIESIWCDSKAQAVFTVRVREDRWFEQLESDLLEAFRAALPGFNGVYVEGGPQQIVFDPEWPEHEDGNSWFESTTLDQAPWTKGRKTRVAVLCTPRGEDMGVWQFVELPRTGETVVLADNSYEVLDVEHWTISEHIPEDPTLPNVRVILGKMRPLDPDGLAANLPVRAI